MQGCRWGSSGVAHFCIFAGKNAVLRRSAPTRAESGHPLVSKLVAALQTAGYCPGSVLLAHLQALREQHGDVMEAPQLRASRHAFQAVEG
jgi:hypothetical protein